MEEGCPALKLALWGPCVSNSLPSSQFSPTGMLANQRTVKWQKRGLHEEPVASRGQEAAEHTRQRVHDWVWCEGPRAGSGGRTPWSRGGTTDETPAAFHPPLKNLTVTPHPWQEPEWAGSPRNLQESHSTQVDSTLQFTCAFPGILTTALGRREAYPHFTDGTLMFSEDMRLLAGQGEEPQSQIC